MLHEASSVDSIGANQVGDIVAYGDEECEALVHTKTRLLHPSATSVRRQVRLLPQDHRVSAFFSVTPADVAVFDDAASVLRYAQWPKAALLYLAAYLVRLVHVDAMFKLNTHNLHRMLISAVKVVAKFINNVWYYIAYYARVGYFATIAEKNKLEMQMLKLFDFKALVEAATKATQVVRKIYRIVDRRRGSPSLKARVHIIICVLAMLINPVSAKPIDLEDVRRPAGAVLTHLAVFVELFIVLVFVLCVSTMILITYQVKDEMRRNRQQVEVDNNAEDVDFRVFWQALSTICALVTVYFAAIDVLKFLC